MWKVCTGILGLGHVVLSGETWGWENLVFWWGTWDWENLVSGWETRGWEIRCGWGDMGLGKSGFWVGKHGGGNFRCGSGDMGLGKSGFWMGKNGFGKIWLLDGETTDLGKSGFCVGKTGLGNSVWMGRHGIGKIWLLDGKKRIWRKNLAFGWETTGLGIRFWDVEDMGFSIDLGFGWEQQSIGNLVFLGGGTHGFGNSGVDGRHGICANLPVF
eukprot:jgi/Botrbrau1/15907/Bobra.40_1s0089.1